MGNTQAHLGGAGHGYHHKHSSPSAVPHSGYSHGTGYTHPGSPLQYAPQSDSQPIVGSDRSGDASVVPAASGGKDSAFPEPAEPNKLPIVITWGGGGESVELQGSFDNWSSRQPMQLTSTGHTLVKLLAPGVYQYKFIVDGEWRYAADQPAILDEIGNVNNVVEVHEYEPDIPGNVAGFDPPPSPPESYDCPLADRTEFAKDPPLMPPQLALTLLNVPSASTRTDGPCCLPRPQHVVLNHLYAQRSAHTQAVVFGTTIRYKAKYITTVLYKPLKSGAAQE